MTQFKQFPSILKEYILASESALNQICCNFYLSIPGGKFKKVTGSKT